MYESTEKPDKSWGEFKEYSSAKFKEANEKINELKDLDIGKSISNSIYKNEYRVVQIEILQYILFLVLVYYYNPMSISTKYTAINNLLVLIVAFIYVAIFIFIKKRKWDTSSDDDDDSVILPDSTKILYFIATILCFILFMYVIKGFIWILMYTSFLDLFRSLLSILIISGIIGVLYIVYTKFGGIEIRQVNDKNTSKFEKIKDLCVNIILYIPCFLIDVAEQIKKEFKLTTKPVWILLIIELVLILSWVIIPPILEKTISTTDGIKLLNDPININVKTTISSFNQKDNQNELPASLDEIYSKKINKKMNDVNADESTLYDNKLTCTDTGKSNEGIKRFINNLTKNIPYPKIKWETLPVYSDIGTHHFKYNFAISAWFYINSFPSNTKASYSKFTNILSYGDLIGISFNSLLNELRVTSGVLSSPIIIYKDNDIKYQTWNNIVINYHDGIIDVFLNGLLVGTSANIEYMKFSDIIVGEVDGLYGGICNVTYFDSPRSSKNIMLAYKLLRNKQEPYLNTSINTKVDIKQTNNYNRDIKHIFAM